MVLITNSNKILIKGFPVRRVISYETGALFARCHSVDQELFGGKLMGLLVIAQEGSRCRGLGPRCAARFFFNPR